ncbi:unnamed protein product [Prunus armeniaca]
MERVKLHTPDMVMLLETKTRSSRYVFLKKVLGMPFMHAMEEAVMVMEDFNDFLDRAEKQRGNSRSERNDKRKEYKNGWTGGLPMIIGYDFSPPQKISIGWLKGLIMLCFVSIHMRARGGRKGILHMIRDGGGMRGLLDWKRREWKNSQLCIDELSFELLAEYQNDIFDYGKVKELEFKLQKALVGKVKELEFKFKISHIFREGNHRVDALANHGVQGSGFTW